MDDRKRLAGLVADDARGSALWGTGNRGGDSRSEARMSALWGKGGRSRVLLALVIVALAAPMAATAGRVRAPETTITSGLASSSISASSTETFTFSSNPTGASFECSVDGGSYSPCNGGSSHTISGLQFGGHSFSVRARNSAGVDKTPETRTFFTTYISTGSYADKSLLGRAKATPLEIFRVIIQADRNTLETLAKKTGGWGQFKREFTSVSAINVKIPGWAVTYLYEHRAAWRITAITEDVPVKPVGTFTPKQVWPKAAKVDKLWSRDAVTCPTNSLTGLQLDPTCVPLPALLAPKAPTIAIVDSGVQPDRVEEFGGRLVHSVAMSELAPGQSADANGHGTFVASVAAGGSAEYPGAAPTADIVSIRVMDANGMALTSDVIRAADWILANKDTYNIRVANFSLHSSRANSFRFDPLDKAVERLWFAGVTVVAASGNFGQNGEASKMAYAPGNDPFVITVGAADTMGTEDPRDDTIAPWSAFGYTLDGFSKPEVVAPGRQMIAAVPSTSTLAIERPDKVVAAGFIQLSGTSFAAPIVAGAAAQILALHPDWTPDQVKGALMLTTRQTSAANPQSDGVGEIDAAAAATVAAPPNPNAALNRFVVSVSGGSGRVFDDASWVDAATADASWADASWADASWADATWADASWLDATWADATWSDASFASASWADATWADNAISDATWADASFVAASQLD